MARETRTRKIQRKLPTTSNNDSREEWTTIIYYEPELVWGILCVFDHEVHILFLKIYTMGELKDREVMKFLWDPRTSEELWKSLYLNLYNFTLILLCKWPSRVCVSSSCGDWRGFLHGPRLMPAVLWGASQFWSPVHSSGGLGKCGWRAEGWGEDAGEILWGQVICLAEWNEWQMGLNPSKCRQQ